ncbi:TetR-like C-terminal domain-containing protein [Streptomyces sp. NPDC001941]|uniref:TetR-like C-terminal domain-containing protein n=1 Tax=Streptomyces sp. NPDC001941 TaxID=3154659 RepID=UPI00332E8E1B
MAESRASAAARPRRVSARRRGPVLERAILDAVLDQLGTVGWSGLTMEGVAAGAGTGKAAVYRRWSSKEELVVDALRTGLPELDDAPDHGDVREDLYRLCLRVRESMYSRPGFALRSLLHECDSATAVRFQQLLLTVLIEPLTRLFRDVVRRAVARGEVRAEALHEMVIDVIPAMLMYRSKVCGSEWDASDIADLIDRVMVPLLRPRR